MELFSWQFPFGLTYVAPLASYPKGSYPCALVVLSSSRDKAEVVIVDGPQCNPGVVTATSGFFYPSLMSCLLRRTCDTMQAFPLRGVPPSISRRY